MSRLVRHSDGTIKTDKGVPIIIVGENDYQDNEDKKDAGCK